MQFAELCSMVCLFLQPGASTLRMERVRMPCASGASDRVLYHLQQVQPRRKVGDAKGGRTWYRICPHPCSNMMRAVCDMQDVRLVALQGCLVERACVQAEWCQGNAAHEISWLNVHCVLHACLCTWVVLSGQCVVLVLSCM